MQATEPLENCPSLQAAQSPLLAVPYPVEQRLQVVVELQVMQLLVHSRHAREPAEYRPGRQATQLPLLG